MGDRGLERAGPAGLRIDPDPLVTESALWSTRTQGTCRASPWLALCRAGSVSASCWVTPVEGVAAVADPVRPGDQLLPAPAAMTVVDAEPVDHVAAVRPSKPRRVAPTSVTTARWAPRVISYCSPVGAALDESHFMRHGPC